MKTSFRLLSFRLRRFAYYVDSPNAFSSTTFRLKTRKMRQNAKNTSKRVKMRMRRFTRALTAPQE